MPSLEVRPLLAPSSGSALASPAQAGLGSARDGHDGRDRRKLAVAQTRTVIDLAVGQVFAVEATKLQAASRGRKGVALARQVGMYLAHVGLGCTLTQVGRVFGRDRTTVAHACAVIEDRRDEPGFDLALQCLEGVVRHQLEARGILPSRHLIGIEAVF